PGVLIGPAHAIRIIASAIAGTVMQGASTDATEFPVHQLPVVDLQLKDGLLMYEGVRFPIEHQPFGNGHEIRSVAEGNSPFGPFDRFTITRPRNADVIGGTLANWIAGRMGVAVPYKSLVQFQLDGDDAGIHEVT